MVKFEGNKEDIVGIGLCTIRYCRAYLKADGTLAQPALSWMDIRVAHPYEHTNPDVKYIVASSGYITHRLTMKAYGQSTWTTGAGQKIRPHMRQPACQERCSLTW